MLDSSDALSANFLSFLPNKINSAPLAANNLAEDHPIPSVAPPTNTFLFVKSKFITKIEVKLAKLNETLDQGLL